LYLKCRQKHHQEYNLKIHKSFFRVNSPHALLDSIQDNGVVYLLSYYFVEAVTGWYSFAFRILKAPVGLIGSAFYQVFYQKLSQVKNEGADLRPLVKKMYLRMFLIGFPGFLLLFLFTPEIFTQDVLQQLDERVIQPHFILPAMGTNEDITRALEAEMGGDLEDGDGQE
jgi:Na+/proline symporter